MNFYQANQKEKNYNNYNGSILIYTPVNDCTVQSCHLRGGVGWGPHPQLIIENWDPSSDQCCLNIFFSTFFSGQGS